MTDNIPHPPCDQLSEDENSTQLAYPAIPMNVSANDYTFIFLDEYFLIHCSFRDIAKKISLHLRELKNLQVTTSIAYHPSLNIILSGIANITHTEHDILVSALPYTSLDWNILTQYISMHIQTIVYGGVSEVYGSASDSLMHNATAPEVLYIPLSYTGPDLKDTAQLLGLSISEFIHWHSSQRWSVAFMGFAPGFAYLRTPKSYSVTRKSIPRAIVPAGSVALGGEYCGIYPRESPGGWQIIGNTSQKVWDPTAQTPNLITPGSTLCFIPL